MKRVEVNPELLSWALIRCTKSQQILNKKFPKLESWLKGEVSPTFKQLETFAKATYTPIGYFFLPEPPEEKSPISDLRSIKNQQFSRLSANLLDTIYSMQHRQDWLREELTDCKADTLDFVGSARLHDDPQVIGQEMRQVVNVRDGWARKINTWQEAVSYLRACIEDLGVIAVINGVVGNNPHRKLDVKEFRGFALPDHYAPLIFVNGADAKSAQMFTLAHELAHIWLGSEGEGLSGFDGVFPGKDRVEQFCDQAAAEFLVPARQLEELWRREKADSMVFEKLARLFKVSPVVVGRRAMDLRLVARETFFNFYEAYTKKESRDVKKTKGGIFTTIRTHVSGRCLHFLFFVPLWKAG